MTATGTAGGVRERIIALLDEAEIERGSYMLADAAGLADAILGLLVNPADAVLAKMCTAHFLSPKASPDACTTLGEYLEVRRRAEFAAMRAALHALAHSPADGETGA